MVERRTDIDLDALKIVLTDSIVLALKRTAEDDEFSKKFWQRGFVELSQHSANGASQWVGKRLLTWMVVAVTSACIVWLVRSGAIK